MPRGDILSPFQSPLRSEWVGEGRRVFGQLVSAWLKKPSEILAVKVHRVGALLTHHAPSINVYLAVTKADSCGFVFGFGLGQLHEFRGINEERLLAFKMPHQSDNMACHPRINPTILWLQKAHWPANLSSSDRAAIEVKSPPLPDFGLIFNYLYVPPWQGL